MIGKAISFFLELMGYPSLIIVLKISKTQSVLIYNTGNVQNVAQKEQLYYTYKLFQAKTIS